MTSTSIALVISRLSKIARQYPQLLFWLSISIFSLIYALQQLIVLPPCSIHLWRQTDCLSFTHHYYDNGLNFFDSQMFNFLFKENTSAKTVGEFPIVYYLVAALWKVFGVHVWIFRLFTYVLFILGLYAIYQTILGIIKDVAWSLFIVLLSFTSPVIVNYSVNFLPDMHAMSLSLIATHMFYKYCTTHRLRHFYWSILFFTLTGLIKPTALIPFGIILGLFCLESIPFNIGLSFKIFRHKGHHLLGFLALFVANALWLIWVGYYNEKYGGWFTHNTIFPMWNYTSAELSAYARSFRAFLINQAFSRTTLYLLCAIPLLFYVSIRKSDRFITIVFTLGLIGCACFAILFFKWDVHDYYMLVLLIFPLLMLSSGIMLMKKINPLLANSNGIKLLAIALLCYNVWYCKSNIEMRYKPNDGKTYLSSSSEREVADFKFDNWSYNKYTLALTQIETYLDSIGVSVNDKVISVPDDTFGTSLYLMNRRGWTGFGMPYSVNNFCKRIRHGAKYLVINDMERAKRENLPSIFLKEKIGEFKNIQIYKLPQYH